MPKPLQNQTERPIGLLNWHPIPKIKSLEYAHPKVKEYVEALVSTAEKISTENRILEKEVYRLNEQLKIYEASLLDNSPKSTKKDSHNSHQPTFVRPLSKVKENEITFRHVRDNSGILGVI